MPDSILHLALDLTANLTAHDRYQRLLDGLRQVVPCDAATLMLLDGEELVPLAAEGLVQEAMGRRYLLADHPRLAKIVASPEPVRFSECCDLPDPFDNLIAECTAVSAVHSCMGCRLTLGERVVGALTLDALAPSQFKRIGDDLLMTYAAFAAAAVHTAGLIDALEQSSAQKGLVVEELQREAQDRVGQELLGDGPAMQQLRQEVTLLAQSDLPALITGETGVGKEVVARNIHHASPRRDQPLIYVNCAALPVSIAESELFGHVRGAYTGADIDRAGRFEAAHGGTLFLDEIGELPLEVQPKLLRVFQSGEVQRVGSDRPLRVDVRVLTATNRDLDQEVKQGRFRADLLHRLRVYPLTVPPLRHHAEDIPLLASHFIRRAQKRLGCGPVALADAARTALLAFSWPGNVRELEHVVLRAVLKASGGKPRGAQLTLTPDHLGLEDNAGGRPMVANPSELASHAASTQGLPLRQAVETFKRHYIEVALNSAQGNLSEASRALGVDRGNLYRTARRLNLR